ncbi:MAG: CvpA family protein [Proteobacteria bacterium]|nr:CvpA family protein [Pseudomonadota bacterium]
MSSLPVNITDLVVVGVVLISGLIALARGFVREVLSLVGWVGAALFTLWSFSHARPYARAWIESPLLADIATGVALFLASLIVFSLVGHGLSSLVRKSALSALDRTLGFVFGLARGVVLLALAYIALASWVLTPGEERPWLQQARSLPLIEKTADLLRRLAPPEFRAQTRAAGESVGRGVKQIKEADKALRALGAGPSKPPASGTESGYKTDERRDMERQVERLLQSAEPPPQGRSQQ